MYYPPKATIGTVKARYYLYRDYLGSILAITDQTGTLKEKRHFDTVGNIVKLTDSRFSIGLWNCSVF